MNPPSIVRYIAGRHVEIRFARNDDGRVEWWLVNGGALCLSDADYDEITEVVRDEIGGTYILDSLDGK